MSFPVGGGSVNHESLYPCVVERATVSGSGISKRLSVCAFRNIEPIDASIDDRKVFSTGPGFTTDAPTTSRDSFCVLMAAAGKLRMDVSSLDAVTAFLQSGPGLEANRSVATHDAC